MIRYAGKNNMNYQCTVPIKKVWFGARRLDLIWENKKRYVGPSVMSHRVSDGIVKEEMANQRMAPF